jgi:hypothetical protein
MTTISHIFGAIGSFFVGIAAVLGLAHSTPSVPVTMPVASSTVASTSTSGKGSAPAHAGVVITPVSVVPVEAISSTKVFSDPNWSLTFAVHSDWSTMPILSANKSLHQLQISGSKYVVFVSKDEGLAVSGSLTSTSAKKTIAGQSVDVRTYHNVEAPFAYYQIFTLKEKDGNYTFLLKSTNSDSSTLDAFVDSITVKK